MTSLLPKRTALDFVERALTAVTRKGGDVGIEHLASSSFQSFSGSVDDAVRFGQRIADDQLRVILEGGSSNSRLAIAIAQQGDNVSAGWLMRPSATSKLGDAIEGADLVGSTGGLDLISHDPAIRGVVTQGRWFPLG